jgi:hypothetical protein
LDGVIAASVSIDTLCTGSDEEGSLSVLVFGESGAVVVLEEASPVVEAGGGGIVIAAEALEKALVEAPVASGSDADMIVLASIADSTTEEASASAASITIANAAGIPNGKGGIIL